MARVARGRRRRYSPSAGGLGTSSSCSTRRSCRTWAPRLQRTTGCLSRPTRAAGSSRGRPPPAVFGPAALARVLGAPATSVSEARTRRTNEEQPTGVSSSLTRLSVVKKPRVKRLAIRALGPTGALNPPAIKRVPLHGRAHSRRRTRGAGNGGVNRDHRFRAPTKAASS
jgi:hypothetical protein